jgi:1-acyl-sn-glycerol-3-phosphate acyltransferase
MVFVLETEISHKRATWLESDLSARVIQLNNEISYWLCRGLSRPLRSHRNITIQPNDVESGKVYVVASNHQSRIDPFVTLCNLPFGAWKRLGAFRFFAYNGLIDVPLLGPFLLGFGSFPTRPHHKHPHGLEYAINQLSRGRSIHIFPEGRRSLPGEYAAHRGVAELAKQPNVMIIPAHIQWHGKNLWHGFDIGIGKPFDGSKMSAQEILDRIYSVPVK